VSWRQLHPSAVHFPVPPVWLGTRCPHLQITIGVLRSRSAWVMVSIVSPGVKFGGRRVFCGDWSGRGFAWAGAFSGARETRLVRWVGSTANCNLDAGQRTYLQQG